MKRLLHKILKAIFQVFIEEPLPPETELEKQAKAERKTQINNTKSAAAKRRIK